MPYKYNEKLLKIPYALKRTTRLTEKEKEKIKIEYIPFINSYQMLADKYKVSKRLIFFIINPDKYKISKQQFKERQKDGRYKYDKEIWAKIMRNHRAYKQQLYINNQLI